MYTATSIESTYLIAKRYGISLETLLAANHLTNPLIVFPGQKLVISSDSSDKQNSTVDFALSQSEQDLLARLVMAESDGEPFEGQIAVAATVLNRLKDPRYPKTITEIIYQLDDGIYQYSPVLDGRISLPASSDAHRAVQQALSGSDPSNGVNGFYNPAKTTSQWVRSQTITAIIGDHEFFKY